MAKKKHKNPFADLDALLGVAKVEAAKRPPKLPEPRLPFDADRFRWLFGTPEGLDCLSKWTFPHTDLPSWRSLIDKEMEKCGASPPFVPSP